MNNFLESVFTTGSSVTPVRSVEEQQVPDMPEIVFSMEGMKKKLEALDTSESTGLDSLPGMVLKKSTHIFAPILYLIFSRSYKEGKVPQLMKEALTTPILKRRR